MLGDHAPIIISIRALRVEGDVNLANVNLCHVISIHALRVEGDPVTVNQRHGIVISIHALWVEGDFYSGQCAGCAFDFYPRPPGGGQPSFFLKNIFMFYFYPRPPGGGRPLQVCQYQGK